MHIGIFDSGVGGLTVAKAIKELMPNIQITYFGDTAHLPYGDKSKELICRYSDEICAFLIQQGCRKIVIACNTASALAKDFLVEKYPEIQFVSVIDPVVDYCVDKGFHSLSLIATKATVSSNAYLQKLNNFKPDLELNQLATPLLVPIIEEELDKSKVADAALDIYLNDFQLGEALILGCTHYPILKEEIRNRINVDVIDGSIITAKYLKEHITESITPGNPDRFFMSDYTLVFERMARRFFGAQIHMTAIKI